MKKHSGGTKERAYVPLMDWWVAVAFAVAILICIACIPMLVWQPIPWEQKLIGACILIVTAMYLVDTAFFTSYRLEKEGLAVVSQLRHLFFPYRTISKVGHGSGWSLISMGRQKRLGLSARGLSLTLSHGPYATIMISPKHRDDFLDELLKRVDRERSRRANREHAGA